LLARFCTETDALTPRAAVDDTANDIFRDEMRGEREREERRAAGLCFKSRKVKGHASS
jgi:hypothetical protein